VYDSTNSYAVIKSMNFEEATDFTDEMTMVESTNLLVFLTEGSGGNLKIQVFDYLNAGTAPVFVENTLETPAHSRIRAVNLHNGFITHDSAFNFRYKDLNDYATGFDLVTGSSRAWSIKVEYGTDKWVVVSDYSDHLQLIQRTAPYCDRDTEVLNTGMCTECSTDTTFAASEIVCKMQGDNSNKFYEYEFSHNSVVTEDPVTFLDLYAVEF
jgi:hypothetical protein